MNIVVLLGGKGQRFKDKGYTVPKPLIKVKNKTLLEHSIESFGVTGKYWFVVTQEDYDNFRSEFGEIFYEYSINERIVILPKTTRGAAESLFHAVKQMNSYDEILQINCDQYLTDLNWRPQVFIKELEILKERYDGVVVTFNSQDPRHSYMEFDSNGFTVNRIVEKKVISKLALVGIHYWKSALDCYQSINEMLHDSNFTNQEYYVSLSYNYMIRNNKKITNWYLGKDTFVPLGTPEDLKIFKDGNF